MYASNVPGIDGLGCDNEGLFISYSENHHFDDNIKITHIFNPHNTETTLLTFNDPFAFIDRNGVLTNPYAVSYTGVWADNRMAEFLPLDYELPVKESIPVDSTVSKNVIARLQKYQTGHVTEKAYLHFDKPYYAAGDTMYFKAYITAGDRHEPSRLSGVLNTDLLSTDNKILQSVKLEISDGMARGEIVLPDSLAEGNYRVRAYTRWMRNNGETDFFDKVIPLASIVRGKSQASAIPVKAGIPKPDIQFFPEGGGIIAGIRSKIAFKAVGTNGLGINVKGEVVDNDNKVISAFSSQHLGMGFFLY